MDNKKVKKIISDKAIARDIVKEIISFGVTDSQKIHIMFLLSLELESGKEMKEISKFLKNFQEKINTDSDDVTIESSKPKKIILT